MSACRTRSHAQKKSAGLPSMTLKGRSSKAELSESSLAAMLGDRENTPELCCRSDDDR
jgi:hypothetical protein